MLIRLLFSIPDAHMLMPFFRHASVRFFSYCLASEYAVTDIIADARYIYLLSAAIDTDQPLAAARRAPLRRSYFRY